ncbi:MAG: hypothetical protein ACI84C_002235 [Flavobacteriales bacterium]|jgi:hypothetical protein
MDHTYPNHWKPVIRFLLTAILCFVLQSSVVSQSSPISDTTGIQYPLRKPLLIGSGIFTGAGSYAGLYMAWYNDFNTGKFHTFDDNGEWLQMDKVGHTMTTYHLGMISCDALRWAGTDDRTSRWVGGLTGFFYQTGIEVMDGFSRGWGFSWGDQAANFLGSAVFISQDLAWGEQRIKLKYSSTPSSYAQYRPELLGDNFQSKLLKDYNGQSYWASLNLKSFMHKANGFPAWVNVAFGYSGEGMIGGHNNPEDIVALYPDVNFTRRRQYLLSLDIDLTKIPVKSPFLKTLFGVIGFIKIPSPTLEVDDHGNFTFHPFYF